MITLMIIKIIMEEKSLYDIKWRTLFDTAMQSYFARFEVIYLIPTDSIKNFRYNIDVLILGLFEIYLRNCLPVWFATNTSIRINLANSQRNA